jgi:hypothetical protein
MSVEEEALKYFLVLSMKFVADRPVCLSASSFLVEIHGVKTPAATTDR